MRGRQREQPRERGPALPAAVGALCRALPPRARPAPDTLRRARFDRPQAVSAGRSAPDAVGHGHSAAETTGTTRVQLGPGTGPGWQRDGR